MKSGSNARRKSALARLEAARKAFIAAGEDRKAYTSTRTDNKGKVRKIQHAARPYDKELARFDAEIAHLKELIK